MLRNANTPAETLTRLVENNTKTCVSARRGMPVPRPRCSSVADLDRQYPGLRFRVIDEQDQMRPHMRFFLNGEQVFDLIHPLRPTDAVYLVQALSGG